MIDGGTFDIDSLCKDEYIGLTMFLDMAIDTEIADIKNYDSCSNNSISKKSLRKAWTIRYKLDPILDTRWSQDDPYNYYCGGNKAGCVVIAMAQILSHFKTPGSVSWYDNGYSGSAYLNWNEILSDCKAHGGQLNRVSTSNSAYAVAGLVRHLGTAFKIDYGQNSSHGKDKNAIKWINNTGVLHATNMKKFDIIDIQRALGNDNLVYAGGYRTRQMYIVSNGHAWVFDGFINACLAGDRRINFMLHCNWGWNGTANGYYLAKSFNSQNGPAIIDTKDVSSTKGTHGEYSYKIEFSIISKR